MINLVQKQLVHWWQRLPLFGSVLFAMLYIIASLRYPGGTYLDPTAKGFSWLHNYWCNLLNETALNGDPNPARPIALSGMIVLCLTLMAFWYLFSFKPDFSKTERYLIQVAGSIAMLFGIFIFTSLHDTVINIAGLFGLIALIGTLRGLRKLGWATLFCMGLFVLVLTGLNNLLYYKKSLIYYLPIVQKITFVYFLVWICLINVRWLAKTTRQNR